MAEYDEAPWRYDAAISPGLVIGGRYRLEEQLAVAGEIATWRGLDQGLARPVLIHLTTGDSDRFGWMLQAARTAAGIEDARFLRVLDAASAHGQEPWSYIVCEHAVGDSLADLLAAGALSSRQAGLLVAELAQALIPQHVNGCFHQCLTPDKVIITANGNVKIAGFLIDAAAAELGQREWSLAQRADMRGLGSLLYAALCANWPVSPAASQRPVAGLAPAPLQGLPPASEQFWVSPHFINSQADPQIANIALATLRPGQGLVGPSLHTAAELHEALISIVGDQGADESLEKLMTERRGAVKARVVTAEEAITEVLATDADAPTQLIGLEPTTRLPVTTPQPNSGINSGPQIYTGSQALGSAESANRLPTAAADQTPNAVVTRLASPAATSPVTAAAPEDFEATRINPVISARPRPMAPTPDPHEPRTERLPAVTDEDFEPVEEPAAEQQKFWKAFSGLERFSTAGLVKRRTKSQSIGERFPKAVPDRRPLKIGLAAVGALLAVVFGIRACDATFYHRPTTPQPVPVAEAFVLDPTADGGDQTENMADAPLAVDGDPATAWDTLVYYNNPKFGGLKPGVGLVVDLGAPTAIHDVTVSLVNEQSAVQLMVPTEPGETAPMDSVNQWSVVAAQENVGTQVIFTPAEVTSRYLLIYFTNLPAVADAQFQSGIAEVTITS